MNSLYTLRAGSLKAKRSTVGKLLSAAGTKGASGADMIVQTFAPYCGVSLAITSAFAEHFVHMIHIHLTSFIQTNR